MSAKRNARLCRLLGGAQERPRSACAHGDHQRRRHGHAPVRRERVPACAPRRAHDHRPPPGRALEPVPAARTLGRLGGVGRQAAGREKVARRYMLIPTICFNCESACGLLAYVDRTTLEVRKFEGNPVHPGSRGRNCAKGPATLNQTYDPERILYPLKRVGERGEGQWKRITWEEALDRDRGEDAREPAGAARRHHVPRRSPRRGRLHRRA